MSNSKTYRKINTIKSSLAEIFSTHKKLIALVFVCSLFGIIIGVSTCISNQSGIIIDNCLDKNLLSFLAGNTAVIRYFFLDLLSFLFCIILIFLFCNMKILFPLSLCLMTYKLFIISFNFCLFIVCFGIRGFVFSVIFFLIFDIAIMCLMIFSLVVCFDNKSLYCNQQQYFQSSFKCLALVVIIFIVLEILKIILLKLISPIFIIII